MVHRIRGAERPEGAVKDDSQRGGFPQMVAPCVSPYGDLPLLSDRKVKLGESFDACIDWGEGVEVDAVVRP